MSFDAFSSVASGSSPNPASSTPAPDTSSAASSTPAQTSGASATQPATTGAKTPSQTPNIGDKAGMGGQKPATSGDPAATPPWEPNFKFKVMDAEHEMDEYFRQFVKTQDDEKKFRELYEKAFGLDVVKPKYQALREKFTPLETELTQYKTQVDDLRKIYSKGDLDTFFKKLAIPEEKVLQWVIDKAQYSQLPPEQRKVLDERRAADDRVYQLEKQISEIQQQYESQVTTEKVRGLQVALEKPDVKQLASVYDSKKGAGAFKAAVVDHGERVWLQSQGKVDLTPDQAVQQVVEMLTMFGSPQMSTPPVIPAQGHQGQEPQAPKPRVIPNMSGRQSSSVGKPKVTSIADLKKLAAQAQ